MTITTTRRHLQEYRACADRYALLCTWTQADDDASIDLIEILDRQGLDDAVWALRACPESDGLARYIARSCAASVLHLWSGPVPLVVREYLRTGEEALMDAARAAAWAAAGAAARAAAGAAAWAAAGAAAWAADAAWSAARDAARAAAWAADAARAAAWAGDAAADAAWAAAGAAARDAAGAAARDAARADQTALLRLLLLDGVPVGGIVEVAID